MNPTFVKLTDLGGVSCWFNPAFVVVVVDHPTEGTAIFCANDTGDPETPWHVRESTADVIALFEGRHD